jgi:hypothetical protein
MVQYLNNLNKLDLKGATMQTIQLNVHSNHLDFLLSVLQNLKDGIVENIIVDSKKRPSITTKVPNSKTLETIRDIETGNNYEDVTLEELKRA